MDITPPGMTLSASGLLSGTPSIASSWSLAITTAQAGYDPASVTLTFTAN